MGKNDINSEAEFVGKIANFQSQLHAFIISLMPGMEGVDDVVQETNLVLWEKRKTFKEGTNFRAWACQIARFKVMNYRKKEANRGRHVMDDKLALMLSEEFEAETGELDARMQALNKCLGRLNDDERGLIEHHYYSDSNLDAYATKSGSGADSLRVKLFRIRAALKKCITSELNRDHHRS
ncbi:MAG: sigma-70 family RNA polymerase sigma factor [Verrucomicrobiae bacterium]|nr:sigma-70 family RNA polymerase sigma factor [Verrucomicrobiae bacterium]NNJ87719.1 sigma-70 family RNA polymerase sigma factor [Akkermansiaceae bacterium]